MTKNDAPQLKDENTTDTAIKNSSTVMEKLNSSDEYQLKPLAIMESYTNNNDLSENHYSIQDFTALQKELRNIQNEVINLKEALYNFTLRYFDELDCFYENLYKDIAEFLKLESHQQKALHLRNALNEIAEIIIYSKKLVDFAETTSTINPLLSKKIFTKKLLNSIIDEMKSLAEESGIRLGVIFGNEEVGGSIPPSSTTVHPNLPSLL
ncbi:MAG TPA: hypothetical protein LFW21_04980 [Rickettsia endosymbiont of Pyrocoelia pectoralis]|nr:hypothetical protein [Rickettsia endosymbiont of Pyrocoelia pectoralis]